MTKCLISIILIDSFNQIVCSSSKKFFPKSSALVATATKRLLSKPSQSLKNGTSTSHVRKKRGVLELAEIIECVTKCDPFSYLEYGCFCGYSGFGFPIDPIDEFVFLCGFFYKLL
jgi:group 10 secretory phospholipase A2